MRDVRVRVVPVWDVQVGVVVVRLRIKKKKNEAEKLAVVCHTLLLLLYTQGKEESTYRVAVWVMPVRAVTVRVVVVVATG